MCMGAGPLWAGAPPLEVRSEFRSEQGGGPRATRQGGQGVTEGQVESLVESGVERTPAPEGFETVGQQGEIAEAHATFNTGEFAVVIDVLDLAVEQVEGDVPAGFAGSAIGVPLAEVCGESIEVEVEAVAGEDGETSGSQDKSHRVQEGIGQVLGTWASCRAGMSLVAGSKATQTQRSCDLSRTVVSNSSS